MFLITQPTSSYLLRRMQFVLKSVSLNTRPCPNRNSLVKSPQDEDPDEGVRDLVELALRKMDYDRDGKISFQDFKSSVTEEPLLLEAFGQCLPADTACQTFLSTLQCWSTYYTLSLNRWSTMYVNKSVINVMWSVVISCTDKIYLGNKLYVI